jgi:hypothetical protein
MTWCINDSRGEPLDFTRTEISETYAWAQLHSRNPADALNWEHLPKWIETMKRRGFSAREGVSSIPSAGDERSRNRASGHEQVAMAARAVCEGPGESEPGAGDPIVGRNDLSALQAALNELDRRRRP